MKKYVAEFIGTMTLVILGCGTAMLVGCDYVGSTGYILTAFAFGLTIIAMAYSIGNISGCHINPAVSLGVLMTGGMDVKEFAGYVISQICGPRAAPTRQIRKAFMTIPTPYSFSAIQGITTSSKCQRVAALPFWSVVA